MRCDRVILVRLFGGAARACARSFQRGLRAGWERLFSSGAIAGQGHNEFHPLWIASKARRPLAACSTRPVEGAAISSHKASCLVGYQGSISQTVWRCTRVWWCTRSSDLTWRDRRPSLELGRRKMPNLVEQRFSELRRVMVEIIAAHTSLCEDYIGKDQLDERVMAAMARVPRHQFVRLELQQFAYKDTLTT